VLMLSTDVAAVWSTVTRASVSALRHEVPRHIIRITHAIWHDSKVGTLLNVLEVLVSHGTT
jgi:hypothetical protein